MERFRKLFCRLICFCLICCCFFNNAKNTFGASSITEPFGDLELKRSLESLRDLDYQTWQLIVYPSSNSSKSLILRIVGFPGSLRIDHPKDLLVTSGRKNWHLQDITKKSKFPSVSLNDSAAEFDLMPLITALDKNRPLRLMLPGLINELPIPPYLVSEWRGLIEKK
tara:strand:- start:240 stop:740 length:501 start_codon:yes stop_codon:yes gene_type:complete